MMKNIAIKSKNKTPQELIWLRTREQARNNNEIFDITPDDIVIPEYCPIKNIKIKTSINDYYNDGYFHLTKINQNLGYTKNNIQIISRAAIITENTFYDKINNKVIDHPYNIAIDIVQKAKRNARKKNIEFNLTVNDIVVPTKCKYLNYKLSFDKNDKDKPYYYSIDRIDSNKGYIKDNVQIISLLANIMKNNSTEEQLVIFSENVLKLHYNNMIMN